MTYLVVLVIYTKILNISNYFIIYTSFHVPGLPPRDPGPGAAYPSDPLSTTL